MEIKRFGGHLFRIFGEGNGNPLQYSCLENPTDRGVWCATVHGVVILILILILILTASDTGYLSKYCLLSVDPLW